MAQTAKKKMARAARPFISMTTLRPKIMPPESGVRSDKDHRGPGYSLSFNVFAARFL